MLRRRRRKLVSARSAVPAQPPAPVVAAFVALGVRVSPGPSYLQAGSFPRSWAADLVIRSSAPPPALPPPGVPVRQVSRPGRSPPPSRPLPRRPPPAAGVASGAGPRTGGAGRRWMKGRVKGMEWVGEACMRARALGVHACVRVAVPLPCPRYCDVQLQGSRHTVTAMWTRPGRRDDGS